LGYPALACYGDTVVRQSLIERIVEERVVQTTVGTVSVAVDRMAEELAREVLADDEFRQSLRTLVRLRSRDLMDRLLRRPATTRRARAKRHRRA
jgi:hypothetical protein